MSSIKPFVSRSRIAYFTMEIAIQPEINTYSGGLGVLAGDTALSCADLELPVVFVTLVSRSGYFRQRINDEGWQEEEPNDWDPSQWCEVLDAKAAVQIEGRTVWIRPWLKVLTSPLGHQIPILLLDTDLDLNSDEDRRLTHHLYGGDALYRLKQEVVLGMGGYRVLRALGFELDTYHLNEGHAAFLTMELLDRFRVPEKHRQEGATAYDVARVREKCVFTTHTPIEAGHDKFPYELVDRVMPGETSSEEFRQLAGHDALNMTRLALNLSGYVNGVARRHAETTRRMFPGYHVRAITNGVHVGTWTHPAFARLFDRTMPDWRYEPEMLVRAQQIPDADVWQCHTEAKRELIQTVRIATGVELDPDRPIIGYARRMTGYKRPLLVFEDLQRLRAIAQERPIQIVMAGKAHPRDTQGKEAIHRIHQISRELTDDGLPCVFLPAYGLQVAAAMVSGADIWLNTPNPPLEASGTSGMKAALNGVLNLSVLDGWWVEGCMEGVTGWSIGTEPSPETPNAADLYDKLEKYVLPTYYDDPEGWRRMMKQAIGYVGSYFNSQRMMRRYASEAYLR